MMTINWRTQVRTITRAKAPALARKAIYYLEGRWNAKAVPCLLMKTTNHENRHITEHLGARYWHKSEKRIINNQDYTFFFL